MKKVRNGLNLPREARLLNVQTPSMAAMKAVELLCPLPLIATASLGKLDNPVIVGVAIFLALLPWLARRFTLHEPMRRTFADGALGLFVIGALVGMWATYDVMVSLPMLLILLGCISLFYTIVHSTGSTRQIGIGLVILAGLLVLYFVGKRSLLIPAFVSFSPHPNAVAGFLEGAFLMSLVLARQARGREQWTWGLAAAIIAGGLLISGSRGSWIGLAVAVGIWVILLAPNWTLQLSAAGLGVIAGILFGVYAVARLVSPEQHIIVLSSLFQTASSRFALYRNSLYLLGDYPFTGVGLGDAFALVYSRYQLLILPPYFFYAHNLFLSVALGFGILGIIALIWLMIGFYRFVVRVERAGLPKRSVSLFRAAWLGTTAIFVHGLTDSPHFSNYRWTMPMLFAVFGLAVAIGYPALKQDDSQEVSLVSRRWSRHRTWMGLAAVTFALISAVVFWRPIAGTWYANLGAIYQTRADLANLDVPAREAATNRAVMYFERALSLNPSHPVANRRLGMIALNRQEFDTAITYLERARQQEPQNQATWKALGLAYQWTGQPDLAAELLGHLDRNSGITRGPDIWSY